MYSKSIQLAISNRLNQINASISCFYGNAVTITSDDLSFNRPPNTDYVSCDSQTPCPPGMICNVYAPCQQGWCDDCMDPYVPGVTDELQFACTMRKRLTSG